MLLIGSHAAKHHLPDWRTPHDIDIILTQAEFDQFVANNRSRCTKLRRTRVGKYKAKIDKRHYELEIATPGSSGAALLARNQEPLLFNGLNLCLCSLQDLLLLKQSHLYQSYHWAKTVQDWHALRAHTDPLPNNEPVLLQRTAETSVRHSLVRLDMSNDAFFQASESKVKRVYDHDDLHLVTCFHSRPLFEACKTDQSKASLKEYLFQALTPTGRLKLVMEECFAIALERRIIPKITKDPADAYMYALQRICTTLTSGWFREFAVEHLPQLWWGKQSFLTPVDLSKFTNYVQRFETAVATGFITPKGKE